LLFRLSERYVIIYSDNNDKYDFIKRIAPQLKRRNFMEYIEGNISGWKLLERVDNPYPYDPLDSENTSFSDFFVYEKN